MSKEQQIIDEIVGKVQDFETAQSEWIAERAEFAELFKVRPPDRKRTSGDLHAFSNPRLSEFYRAVNAIGTLTYRMQTSQEPIFDVYRNDLRADVDRMGIIRDTLNTQLRISKYRPNLLKADMFAIAFGTVVAQEDYRMVDVNGLGLKMPVTTFRPRVMDQVAFERGTVDIEESDWITTADLVSAQQLKRLVSQKDKLGVAWNKRALEAAADHKESISTINTHVKSRMDRAKFSIEESLHSRKELLFYYGKLDTMNDGVEYVAALVNRRFLVRFHANNFQHGMRQFRIGKWIDFDEATGLGLGDLLAPQHRSMDANRQKIQDMMSFGTYNMWARMRSAGIDDNDLKIRPLQIVDMDERDGLTPLKIDLKGAEAGLKLEEILKQEFRAASGATDTLQALITDATASEVSLAQNESIRNISVKAELLSEKLVREHLQVMHANNVQNINKPFNVNISGIPRAVYPKDLKVDVDFSLKMTTDKDFRPQRLEKIINLIQILTSTKSQHQDLQALSIVPLVKEAAHAMGISPEELTQPVNQQGGLSDEDIAAQAFGTGPGEPGAGGVENVADTPVGPTLTSPQ